MQEAESNVSPVPVSGKSEASARFNKMLDSLQYSGNTGTQPSSIPNAITSHDIARAPGVSNANIGTMKVIELASGQRGTINADEFDPKLYAKA
jgi:hypothetical protein